MESILVEYFSYRKSGSLDLLEESMNEFLDETTCSELLDDRFVDRLNSFLSFALCSPSGLSLRLSTLRVINKIADDDSNRCALITQYSILRPLLYGILQWQEDSILVEALRSFYLCTFDIHYIIPDSCDEILVSAARKAIKILRSPETNEMTDLSLGILANLSRITSVMHKALHKREDFAVLRKALLHIMNGESSSQIKLVLSMTVRFHLWGVQDKFFDDQNFHTTVQILFNILLNGEFNVECLYAGSFLIDFCKNQKTFDDIKSYPDIRQALREITKQLASKNAKLVCKLLEFLSSIVKQDEDLCSFVRTLIFGSVTDDTSECSISAISEHLLQMRNNFLSAAVASFIYDIELSFSRSSTVTSLTNRTTYSSSLFQLLSVITQSLSNIQRLDRTHLEGICRRRMLMRCASFIIQQTSRCCSSLDAESVELSAGHISRLAFVVQSHAQQAIQEYRQIAAFIDPCERDEQMETPVNNDYTIAEMVCTVEALDLLLTCIDFLATALPLSSSQKMSQENADPMDPAETHIDCTPQMAEMRLQDAWEDAYAAAGKDSLGRHLRRCGDALQGFLESPLTAPMLALALATGGNALEGGGALDGCCSAVLRLLRVALGLPNFASKSFVSMMSKLLPPSHETADNYITNRLMSHLRGVGNADREKSSFPAAWITATRPRLRHHGDTAAADGVACEPPPDASAQSTLNRLSMALDNSPKPAFVTVAGSEAMAICLRKIEILQSREAVLEADAAAKADALRTSDAVAEHFRNRAVTAEAEVLRLLSLQMGALAAAEIGQNHLATQRDEITRFQKECKVLSGELTAKCKDLDALQTARNGLQSKLNNMREQIKTMDATIDDYRKQLDDAKHVIQQKDAQIQQYTHMTRIINQLTGSEGAAVADVLAVKKS